MLSESQDSDKLKFYSAKVACRLTAFITMKQHNQDYEILSNSQTDHLPYRQNSLSKYFVFYLDNERTISQQAEVLLQNYSNLLINKLYFELDRDRLSKYRLIVTQIASIFITFIEIVQKRHRFVTELVFKDALIEDSSLRRIQDSDWKFIIALNLSFNNISFEGIRILAQMNLKRLKKLNLGCNNLGNRGITNVYRCDWPCLFELDIRCTNITKDIVKILQKSQISLESLALSFGPLGELLSTVQKLSKTNYKQIYISNENSYIQNDLSSLWHFSNIIVKSPNLKYNLKQIRPSFKLQTRSAFAWIKTLLILQMKQKIKLDNWLLEYNII